MKKPEFTESVYGVAFVNATVGKGEVEIQFPIRKSSRIEIEPTGVYIQLEPHEAEKLGNYLSLFGALARKP